MKTKILAAVTMAALISGSSLRADETLSQTFNNLPKVEIPAYASKLVLQADKEARQSEAAKVVKIIALQNETLLVQTVAAISKAAPELAVKTAAVAAKASPKLAEQISLRASQAAPEFAPQIAAAVSKEVPKKAYEIASLTSAGTEGADLQIVSAVREVAPTNERLSRLAPGSNGDLALTAQAGETVTVTAGGFGSENVEEIPENYFSPSGN